MRSIRSLIFNRFYILVTGFFVVVSAVVYLLSSRAMNQLVIDDHNRFLSFLETNIESNIRQELGFLEALNSFDGFQPFTPTTAQRSAKQFLSLNTLFGSIHVYRPNGDLVFATAREDFPKYRPDQNFFQRHDQHFAEFALKAMKERKPEFSYTIYSEHQYHYFAYLVPLIDRKSDQVIGVLSGGIFPTFKKLDSLLTGLRMSKHDFLIITDLSGHIIAQNGIVDDQIDSNLAAYIHKFQDGSTESVPDLWHPRKLKGDYWLLKTRVSDLPLVIVMGVSHKIMDEKLAELSRFLAIGLGLGFLFALLASAIIAKNFAKPFYQIAHSVRQLSIGNFSFKTTYRKTDELGHICTLLDRLGAKLAKDRILGEIWSNELEIKAMKDPSIDMDPQDENPE